MSWIQDSLLMTKTIKNTTSALKKRLVNPVCMLLRFMQAIYHSRELKCVQNSTGNIGKSDILLFATLRNEALQENLWVKI